MRLSKRGRRKRPGRHAWKIYLPFAWLCIALGKHLAGRHSLLRRPKLHDAHGRKEHLAWAAHAEKGTVRRHGLARVAPVHGTPAVLRDP
jgi:hypothetical protein